MGEEGNEQLMVEIRPTHLTKQYNRKGKAGLFCIRKVAIMVQLLIKIMTSTIITNYF